MKRAVIGGGVLGCTLALELARRGEDVTMFEAADDLGGLAGAWRIGELTWDRHYHVTLLSDVNTRWLLDQLGLDQEIHWRQTRTGVYARGQLYSATTPREFLQLPFLTLVDKARLGMTVARAATLRDATQLATLSAEKWLTRWSGRRAFEAFWRPLLVAKLGDAYREVSATFIWATIQRLFKARRSGMGAEQFGYVAGGYARVFEQFTRVLGSAGVKVQLGASVTRVRRTGRALTIELADGSSHEFEAAVCTVDAPTVRRIAPGLSNRERAQLDRIQYQGIVCASVLLRRPLGGYYLTNITDDAPFTGVVEMTALVDPATFDGYTLVYLPKYVAPTDELFAASDSDIRAVFMRSMSEMFGVTDTDLVAFKVSRVRRVFVVPTVRGEPHRMPFTTSVPGLSIVNSSQIVDGTLNVDETVALARAAATALYRRGLQEAI